MRNSFGDHPSIPGSFSCSLSSGEPCEGGVSTEALKTPFMRFPSEESITGACWELLEGNTLEPTKRSQNSRPQWLQAYFPPEVLLGLPNFCPFYCLFSLSFTVSFVSPAKEPMRPEGRGIGVRNDGKLICQNGG